MLDRTALADEVTTVMDRPRGTRDTVGLRGDVVAELYGPDGQLKRRVATHNLVTNVGDNYFAGRAVLSTGLPAQITGMKLGTGSTAVAKSGAGAALVTYLAGSNKAIDGGYPTVSGGVATFRRTYAAGEASSGSPITEAVLVNDSIGTDATSAAANTIARVLLTGIGSKGANDTLTITWAITLLGA